MTCNPIIQFNVAEFRTMYPAFADPTVYSDMMLQMYWDQATSFVSDLGNYGWMQGGSKNGTPAGRTLALYLMTAHIAQIFVLVAQGQTPAPVTAAGIDKVSVSLMPPPAKDGWQYWLATTPYGQQLWALLTVNSVGGWYTGGYPTRAGFGPGPGAWWSR